MSDMKSLIRAEFEELGGKLIKVDTMRSVINHLSEMELTLITEIDRVTRDEDSNEFAVKLRLQKAQMRLDLIQEALKETRAELAAFDKKLDEFTTV